MTPTIPNTTVVARWRTPDGRWAATKHVPATDQAVRAVARQNTTQDGAA